MQFCRLALHADVVDTPGKTGLDVPGAEQVQERGLGVGIDPQQFLDTPLATRKPVLTSSMINTTL